MKKILPLLLIISAFADKPLFAQNPVQFSHVCAFAAPVPLDSLILFEPDERSKKALELIMQSAGLPQNFVLRAAAVPNACAVVRTNFSENKLERYILYNPSFFSKWRDSTKSRLVEISVLAHEAGHHLAGHTLDQIGSRPHRELEADHFLGSIFFKMGASLPQAQLVLSAIASDSGSETHPAKKDRLAAIAEGWTSAQSQAAREVTTSKPLKTTRVTRPAHVYFGKTSVLQMADEIKIETDLNIGDLRDEDIVITAWFFDSTTGQPLRDIDQKYRSRSGGVSTSVVVRPLRQKIDKQAVALRIPNEELHLPKGQHHLLVCLGASIEGRQTLGEWPRVKFVFQH